MIEQKVVEDIASSISESNLSEDLLSSLRQQYEGLHFTYCNDDDLPNNDPIIENEKFNIYLVDGREHCMVLTNDFDKATGVVIAEIYED